MLLLVATVTDQEFVCFMADVIIPFIIVHITFCKIIKSVLFYGMKFNNTMWSCSWTSDQPVADPGGPVKISHKKESIPVGCVPTAPSSQQE